MGGCQSRPSVAVGPQQVAAVKNGTSAVVTVPTATKPPPSPGTTPADAQIPQSSAPISGLFPPRPAGAKGAYLRVLGICDSYTMQHYPQVCTAIKKAKEEAAGDTQGCVVISTHSGDFLSPAPLTSLDFGHSLMEGMNAMGIDYACFGNHEFDLVQPVLQKRVKEFKGTMLNSNIRDPSFIGKDGNKLPEYAIIPVGTHKVAIGGFCTGAPDIYRPGTLNDVVPIIDSVKDVWQKASAEGADAYLPLTHQLVHEDKELVAALHKDPATKGRAPVILGGHEHELYEVFEEGGTILKVGQDAVTMAVVDLWWTGDDQLHHSYELLPTSQFDEDPQAAALISKKEDMLSSVRAVSVCTMDSDMSSKGVRQKPEKIPSMLCTKIKQSSVGADICLLQGGCIRGKLDYKAGCFTYGDLMTELAFETEICTIKLPGHIIAESVKRSRATPEKENACYLHHDLDTVFEDYPSLGCLQINGQLYEPEREYTVAIYHVLVVGMNEVQPLLGHIQGSGMHVPSLEETIPAKQLVLETCMKEQWRGLVGIDLEDKSVTEEAKEAALDALFAKLDSDRNGLVSKAELAAYLPSPPGGEHSDQLLTWLISTLDADNDSYVSAEELRNMYAC